MPGTVTAPSYGPIHPGQAKPGGAEESGAVPLFKTWKHRFGHLGQSSAPLSDEAERRPLTSQLQISPSSPCPRIDCLPLQRTELEVGTSIICLSDLI